MTLEEMIAFCERPEVARRSIHGQIGVALRELQQRRAAPDPAPPTVGAGEPCLPEWREDGTAHRADVGPFRLLVIPGYKANFCWSVTNDWTKQEVGHEDDLEAAKEVAYTTARALAAEVLGLADQLRPQVSALRDALEGGTTFPDLSRIGWLSALLAEDFESHINWDSIEDPEAWHTAIRESRDLVRLVREALADTIRAAKGASA